MIAHVDFRKPIRCSAHKSRLFLLRPVAGTIHQLHSSEFRIPGLSGSLSASRDPVGAPVLLARNELRGDVDGPPRECELLGDVCGKRGTAVPVIVQGPGPPRGVVFLPVDIALRLSEPLAVRDVLLRRHVRDHRGRHSSIPSHHVVLRHPRVLCRGLSRGRHRPQGRQVLVAGKLAAFHVIERAEEIAHALRHVLHVFIGLPAGPVLLIVAARRIELRELRVEFRSRVGRFSFRACERERWRCAARRRNRRQAEKHVGSNDGGIRGNELTLIVPDDELRLPVAERIDERDLVAHHVERQERRGIRVPGSVPANRAPIPAAVRRDHVVTRVCERRHHFAPAVAQVRKPMEQQYERPPLRPCLEHVDGEAVDVRHEPRCDARGKRVVAVRRQLLEGRHCRDLRRCSGGRDRHASERRSAREKLASRESGRRRAFHVASLRFIGLRVAPSTNGDQDEERSPERRTPCGARPRRSVPFVRR